MSPTLVTFLFEAANFLLLAALLAWLFFRPVRDALERRRHSLEEQRQHAAAQLAEAERRLAELASRQHELDASLAEQRERARAEARSEAGRLLDAARADAERERERLQRELAGLRLAHARAVGADAAAAAGAVVRGLLERIDGPPLEEALVRAVCRELEGLARGGAVTPVLVESMGPLDPGARALLVQALDIPEAQLEQRVVPSLGAGLRVVTRKGVIDATAAGLAARAQGLLAARLAPARSSDA